MFRRQSIRSVLFFTYSIILALILSISLLLFYLWASDTLRKEAADSLSHTSLSVKEKLDLEIQKMNTVSMNILYSNLVKEKFLAFSTVDQETTAPDLKNAKELSEILVAANGPAMPVQQVNLYDFEGNLFGSGFDNRIMKVSLPELPWYEEVMKGDSGKVITIPAIDEQLRHVVPTRDDVYSISLLRVFVDKYNTPEGIVEVKQSIGTLFKSVLQPAEEGVIVFNDKAELVYPIGPGHEIEQAYARQFLSQPNGGAIRNPVTGERELAAVSHSDFTGWNSAVILSEQKLFKPLRTFTIAFIVFSACILVLAVLLSYLAAKRITKPIARLYQYIRTADLESLASPARIELNSGLNELDRLQIAFDKMGERVRYSMEQQLISQQQELQAKMLALQSQMNPHFLYNTLATISIMAEENMNAEITGMIENLTDILRYISSDSASHVDLATELAYTEKYLDCIHFRYGKRLSYSITIDEELRTIQVPKLIIQPLVENAIKYSTKSVPPWHIGIRVYAEGELWFAEVRDNGPGFKEEERGRIQKATEHINRTGQTPSLQLDGMGLLNVYLRLKVLYGQRMTFAIENATEGGACVIIGGVRMNREGD